MNKRIYFEIEGDPVGKGRPRFYHGHAVTPAKTREYEERVRLAYFSAADGTYFEKGTAVTVNIVALFPIPKSYSKKRWLKIASGQEAPLKKPDIDNISKIILDGLAVAWNDDTQVDELHTVKRYTLNEPRVLVEIIGKGSDENGDTQNVCKDDCAK